MFKRVTRIALNMATAVWGLVAAAMLASGYSDRLSPETFSWVSALGLVFPMLLVANLLFLFFFLTVCWRRAWLPIAAYLLVYPPISLYMPLHFGQADIGTQDTLSVMSYNVQGFNGPGIEDDPSSVHMNSIIRFVRANRPDLLCLQECTGEWRGYLPRLDSIYAHRDTAIICKTALSTNAIGIFTRYPIIKRDRIQYASLANGSFAWQLKCGRDTMLVVVNHLESTHLGKQIRSTYRSILHGDEPSDTVRSQTRKIAGILGNSAVIRVRQAEAVAAYTDSVRRLHPQWPVIVCGDFNDPPISYTHRTMARNLTDCYQEAGCGLGWSMMAKAFPVRIDNILCSDRFRPVACRVDRSLEASDHYPIIATLTMKK